MDGTIQVISQESIARDYVDYRRNILVAQSYYGAVVNVITT
jgi:hypothetical protein